MRGFAATVVIGAVVAVIVLSPLRAGQASAHPLGNFTVNHHTRIDLTAGGVEVFRVLDLAEIPAFREVQAIDRDGSGDVEPAEAEAYASATAQRLRDGMDLRIEGEAVELTVAEAIARFPEGQGGLSLVRVEVTYKGTLPGGWQRGVVLSYEDRNDLQRIGWREVVVRAGPGVVLTASDAPSASPTDGLRAYPQDGLRSPPDVRTVRARLEAGTGAPLPESPAATAEAVRGNPDATLGRFADLVAHEELGWSTIALAVAAAVGFGAIHALSPGHGKTVVAAYLVGSRGTWRHAVFLAAVVTVTHTSSVYALGFVSLYLSEYVLAESLYPWLGVASGALVLGMGIVLLVTRLRASGMVGSVRHAVRFPMWRAALAAERGALAIPLERISVRDQTQHQPHDDPDHDHAHVHGHDAHSHGFGPHTHRIPGQDGERVTLRSLLGLGVFGGMIPCPSAIVVMLSAISLHRVGFGLVLIAAFSLGLAAVLSSIGFALVYGQRIGGRLPFARAIAGHAAGSRVGSLALRAFPSLAAAAVVAAGALITLRAAQQF